MQLREKVTAKSEKLDLIEIEARAKVDVPVASNDEESGAVATPAEVTNMKQTMEKLGGNLDSLARELPEEMEGFARTIEAVQADIENPDDVDEAIAGRKSLSSSKSPSAKSPKTMRSPAQSSVGAPSPGQSEGGQSREEDDDEEEEGEDDDAEDAFASLVGR